VCYAKSSGSFESVVLQTWGKKSTCAMDLYRAAANQYSNKAVVLIGPEGDVLWSGGSPNSATSYRISGGRKENALVADTRANVTPYLDKGLLKGLDIPRKADSIVELIHTGQYSKAIKKLKSKKSSMPEFSNTLLERLEQVRQKKLAFFEKLIEEGDNWGAYKVGSSYTRCFSSASEVSKVKSKVSKLKQNKNVRDNISALNSFRKFQGVYNKLNLNTKEIDRVRSDMSKFADKYEGTEIGDIVSNARK